MNSSIVSKQLKLWRRYLYVFAAACSVAILGPYTAAAHALSNDQLNVLNSQVYYFNTEVCDSSASNSTLTGTDNVSKAFNYLIGKGLNKIQAAGILGNLEQESGGVINPGAEQTAGAWQDTSNDSGHGVGIAQWDGGRRAALLSAAKAQSANPQDLAFQLDYLWHELTTSYTSVLQHLKSATAIEDAVNQFVGPDNTSGQPVSPTDEVARSGGYENPSAPNMANRIQRAQDILQNTVASTTGTSSGPTSGCSQILSSSNTGNVVFISQRDPRWAGQWLRDGNGDVFTVFNAGCWATSVAMIISTFTGQMVTPMQTEGRDVTQHVTFGSSGLADTHYGALPDGAHGSFSQNDLMNALQLVAQHKALIMAHGSGLGSPPDDGPWYNTPSHWVVVRDYVSGRIFVNDPWDLPATGNPNQPQPGGHSLRSWSVQDFMSYGLDFDVITKKG